MIFKKFKNVVAETYTEIVKCKYCGLATAVVRYGKSKGRQVYFCQKCNRKFLDNKAMPNMKTPTDAIGASIGMFYEGLSFGAISRQLWQIYKVEPDRSTIYDWVVKYSKVAVDATKDISIQVGDTWVVDESVLNIGGQNVWFWDVIDETTRFLLASHLSLSRSTRDALTIMTHAQKRAGISPKFIISDKLAAYIDGIERVFGADTWHLQGSPFSGRISTALIERFHGTVKNRTKVMRGLKTLVTARLILDGWLVHYNWLRPHESLEKKTPAQVAKARIPFFSWTDVVRKGG